jgi:hypothetical protein
MIHPNLFPSTAHAPLTESQKQVWKTAIRNQPSKANAYRRTPVENYNLLKSNDLVHFLKNIKTPNKIAFLTAFFLLGLNWRFSGMDWIGVSALTWIIQPYVFTAKNHWNFKVTATGITIAFNDEYQSRLEIPFQQIICMDFEQYYDDNNNRDANELVIYYAHHNGGYLLHRTPIIGNEADTMGIIHYFLNQYQNALPQKP